MELLMHALCRATVTLPVPVIEWMVRTAHPLFQPWRDLVRRPDLTDQQAWDCLWSGDALIRSAMKISGKWTANATSEQLSDGVALYLSRPDVPAGRIELLRTRLDADQLHRIDLLRAVTRLNATDLVCHEIVAEPPPRSSRQEHVGTRELALVERYRAQAQEVVDQQDSAIKRGVAAIVREEGLIARVAVAWTADPFDPLATLRACLFGRGSVAARPEDADHRTAQQLVHYGRNASTYRYDAEGLGEVLSALRPILRAYLNPGYTPPRQWVTDRLLTFGEAGVVPLSHSIKSEEGDYIVRRFGADHRKYQALGEMAGSNEDVALRELCDQVEAAELTRHRCDAENAGQDLLEGLSDAGTQGSGE